MTRAIPLPARQVTALCKGAAKAGYVPLVEIGGVVIRLVPEKHAIPQQKNQAIEDDEDIRL